MTMSLFDEDGTTLEWVDVHCQTPDCSNGGPALTLRGLLPSVRALRPIGGRVVCGVCGQDSVDVRAVVTDQPPGSSLSL